MPSLSQMLGEERIAGQRLWVVWVLHRIVILFYGRFRGPGSAKGVTTKKGLMYNKHMCACGMRAGVC